MSHPYQQHPLETDLSSAEREAWSSGDYERAELLGALMDQEGAATRADEAQHLLDTIRERIAQANWRTGKKAELRELVETIISELNAEGA